MARGKYADLCIYILLVGWIVAGLAFFFAVVWRDA